MNSSDIIPTIAELAIGLAAFSAVVVVLNPIPIQEWHRRDRFNLRILLQIAAFAAFFSILPFVIHTVLENDVAWKVSLLVYGFIHLLDLATFVFNIPKDALRINRILPLIGFGVAFLQISVGFLGHAKLIEVTYLAALTWHLAVAFTGFILLIYRSGNPSDE